MYITAHQLLGLPVETQAGEKLGKVVDIEIDVESHLVQKYHVKSGSVITGLFHNVLLVDRTEVIVITKEKMTVEDRVAVRAQAESRERSPGILTATAPTPIQSQIEQE
ncbi:PRC-barrel domain-containing protein [Candidatus Uhrbacteria bacterium]|nr:PRC-barrel domain-containing protein [Candidatus Uhrbacteria bacterium]